MITTPTGVVSAGLLLLALVACSSSTTPYASRLPSGLIASAANGGIVSFNLDGSHYTTITHTYAGNVAWAPTGTSIVFDQTEYGAYNGGPLLLSVTTQGVVSTLDSTDGSRDAWPVYSHDGQWIYYGKVGSRSVLWRVHPDGSGDAAVPVQANDGVEFPSVAPDNSKIAYVVPGDGSIKVLTLSSGSAASVGVYGYDVAWAPTGDVLAYITTSNQLALVNSDGTGDRVMAPGRYLPSFSWSPDGKYLIAQNFTTLKLDVIDVTTGVALPVDFTGRMASPSWK